MSFTWEEHFDHLVDLDAGERARRLAVLDGTDPAMAGLLRQMLAADDSDGGELLAAPLAEQAPALVAEALAAQARPSRTGRDRADERIGPYRLLSLLGRGGMAEVWLAERADGEFEHRVALKLVRSELGSEAILARFLRERRILARLEHPVIARLLDGGRSGSGEPYFVLEHVDGTPITGWCAARNASLEERLRLVIELCEGIDHAHRNLVVHRDLKPTNILVDRAGRPKLLDFGIAKLLAPEPAGDDPRPSTETRAFTPSYAAPEQILGEPVTTATDVYALGALLYELLTGETPHLRAAGLLPALAREIEFETVERPSERLRRAVETGAAAPDMKRLAARLEGDLDTILAKALHRQPERRYSSAAALAEDLRRFLGGRTVSARPDSLPYRTGLFLRRHRLGVATAALAVLSLVAGLAVSLWQAEVARAEARRAERVRGFLIDLFREADPSHTRGATITAREILEIGAARVERELHGEPEVKAELLDAIAQVENSLGLFATAEQRARSALALRTRVYGPAALETAASRLTLAASLYQNGRVEAARGELAVAARTVAALEAEGTEVGDRLGNQRNDILWNDGRAGEALTETRRWLAHAEAATGPKSLRAARWRINLVGALAGNAQVPEALKLARPALAALERAPEASPVEIAYARVLVAEVLGFAGRKEESVRLMGSGVALARQTLGPRHPFVAFLEIKYGFILTERRRYDEAESVLRNAISVLSPLQHYEEGSALRHLGLTAKARHRYAEAERLFTAAEKVFLSRLGKDHPYVLAARLDRGEALLRLGRPGEAEVLLRALIPELERVEGPQGDSLRTLFRYLGEARRLQGDVAEALAFHRRGRDITIAVLGTAEHVGVAAQNLQIALDHLAKPTPDGLAEARLRVDEGIAILRKLDPENPRLAELLAVGERIENLRAPQPRPPARVSQGIREP